MHTPDSHHPYPIYPNLVKGRTPDAPDAIWVADFTHISLSSEFVYLATFWLPIPADVWGGICPRVWILIWHWEPSKKPWPPVM